MFDLETRKQRHVVLVAFDTRGIAGHDMRHELLRLLEDIIGINQDFADFGMEIVADGADDQAGFLINKEHATLRLGRTVDRGPQLLQVVQIPLEFFQRTADAGGAGNQARAAGHFQLIHDLAQLLAVFSLDTA